MTLTSIFFLVLLTLILKLTPILRFYILVKKKKKKKLILCVGLIHNGV